MKRTKQINVHRALALSGVFHFLVCCSRSCLLPFLTLYLRRLGLTPAMTGVVMGTKHLIALLWSPAASLLAKRYNKRRAVILASLLGSASVALTLLLVPPTGAGNDRCNATDPNPSLDPSLNPSLDPNLDWNRFNLTPALTPGPSSTGTRILTAGAASPSMPSTLQPHESHPQTSANASSTSASSTGNQKISVTSSSSSSSAAPARARARIRNKKSIPEEENSGEFLGSLKAMDPEHQLFFLVLMLVSFWESASAPLDWTAADGLHDYLDFADASEQQGSGSGVWGLLGGALGVGGAGLLVSRLRCPNSAVHFYLYASVASAALPVAAFLPLYLNRKRDRGNGLLKAVQLIRGSPRAVLCAATALLLGAASSVVSDFLLWQMQDHGASELHMGVSLALAALSEAAFPLLAGRVSRLLSAGSVLAVAAAALALQCLYFSFLWAPWSSAPAQVLSCFSGGALWWAVWAQCEDVATPGAERTLRRVYGATALHVGGALGSFAAGFVVQRFGLAWLFRGVAVAVVSWCVCLPVLQWKAPRQRRINYSRLLAADASDASDSESEPDADWLEKAIQDDKSNNNNNNGRRTRQ